MMRCTHLIYFSPKSALRILVVIAPRSQHCFQLYASIAKYNISALKLMVSPIMEMHVLITFCLTHGVAQSGP